MAMDRLGPWIGIAAAAGLITAIGLGVLMRGVRLERRRVRLFREQIRAEGVPSARAGQCRAMVDLSSTPGDPT